MVISQLRRKRYLLIYLIATKNKLHWLNMASATFYSAAQWKANNQHKTGQNQTKMANRHHICWNTLSMSCIYKPFPSYRAIVRFIKPTNQNEQNKVYKILTRSNKLGTSNSDISQNKSNSIPNVWHVTAIPHEIENQGMHMDRERVWN